MERIYEYITNQIYLEMLSSQNLIEKRYEQSFLINVSQFIDKGESQQSYKIRFDSTVSIHVTK